MITLLDFCSFILAPCHWVFVLLIVSERKNIELKINKYFKNYLKKRAIITL